MNQNQPIYDDPPDEFPPPPPDLIYDHVADDFIVREYDDAEEEEEDPYEMFAGKPAEIPVEGYVQYSYEIGAKGRGPGQFGGWVQHFAVSEDGSKLYTCDVFNKRIQIMSLPDRKYIHSFTTTMPQYNFQARGIAVLRNGNLCINCVGFDGTSRVGIFTPEGHLVNSFGQGVIGAASAMAVDPMDRISIVDRRKMKIMTLSKDGRGIGAFTNPVKQDCLRLCANGRGELLIPDHLNNAVWLCDENGVIKAKIKPPGGPMHGFVYPAGVAVDCNDDIFICDVGNHRVMKFSADGEYKRSILSKADNSLWRPHDIAISKRGHVLVSEVNKTFIKLMGFQG